MPNFQQINHFFAMGGYACYVWPAYLLAGGVLISQWFFAKMQLSKAWLRANNQHRMRT
jgi:heme exporter protein D